MSIVDTPSLTSQIDAIQNQMRKLISIVQGSHHELIDDTRNYEDRTSEALPCVAERLYADRQKRSSYFNNLTLREPAWDILLDLYASHSKNRRISITSACLAANAPTTTALRHIEQLERAGVVSRYADQHDGRRQYLQFTEIGFRQMEQYLRTRCIPVP